MASAAIYRRPRYSMLPLTQIIGVEPSVVRQANRRVRTRLWSLTEGADMNLQQAMKNPNVVFASPEELEASTEFTTLQKRAILMQWRIR